MNPSPATAGRPLVMGIVNVTPDSFSDGGQFLDQESAIAHGMDLVAQGADLVDVGGESTRPGALMVDEATELGRIVPVVSALAPHVRVSVDTTKPGVARAAVAAGATLINDISASLAPVAAELGVGWVAMHSRGAPATMQSLAVYDDVVSEVVSFLTRAAEEATALGIEEVWIDPGIGFAKTGEHNLQLLARMQEIVAVGPPVLVGTSRKAFLGHLLAESDRKGRARGEAYSRKGAALDPASAMVAGPVAPDDRLEGSVATVTFALAKGARMVRVHDVRASVQAAAVVAGCSTDEPPDLTESM